MNTPSNNAYARIPLIQTCFHVSGHVHDINITRKETSRMQTYRKPSAMFIILCLVGGIVLTPGLGMGQEQSYNTLELVRTYQSEEEYRAAHPELFSKKMESAPLSFAEVKRGPTIEELTFTPEEHIRLSDPNNIEPIKRVVYDYWKVNNEFLVVSEHELELYNTFEIQAFDVGIPTKQTLYNRHSQAIADLPVDINTIKLSPDKQHFIAYYDGEDVSRHLYFYKRDGTLLQEYELYAYPQAKYSVNGEYVTFLNIFGTEFYIFTKQGGLVFKGDMRNYNPQTNLNTLFVSNNANYILLGTDHSVILLDYEGNKLWEKPSSYVRSAYFKSDRNLLVVDCVNVEKAHIGIEDSYMLKLVSLNTGELSDDIIKDISYFHLVNNEMFFKRGDAYYEYKIK